jgi:hypothetical protein
LLREDPLSPGILDMFFLKIYDYSSLCKNEVIYLKLLKFSTDSTRMIRVKAGSSIPYLVRSWDHSLCTKSLISEVGLYNIVPNITFYRDKCALFSIFCFFESMGVS